jgi:hypothetical protein
VNKRSNKRIHRDKEGRQYQKQSYFIGGKMKFCRVYVIDGIPVDEFYENNATEIELVKDNQLHLIDENVALNNRSDISNPSHKKDVGNLPF